MPKKNLDRRAFLKGAALAALAPAAHAAQAAPAAHKWDKEADVVVIGSGASGLPASIIAKENGASVILVEANRDIGGHAAVCHRQHPAGRRHQGPERGRNCGFARYPLQRPHRLVRGGAQRRRRLPFQRPRHHSRIRRQQRFRLRLSRVAWTSLYEDGARLWRHDQRGQVGAQGHARGRHGITR